MKPVDQTIFINDPEGRVGNCLQAVLASLLEKPLDEVPHFAAMSDEIWFDEMCKWLNEQGYVLMDVDGLNDGGGYTMVIGLSERGVSHVVIYKNGNMVHDPHPSRTGLAEVKWSGYLLPKQ